MKPKTRQIKPTITTVPNDVIFGKNFNGRGFYLTLLQDLMRDTSKCICITKDDKSAYTQIVGRAKKLGMRLLRAEKDNFIYFKIFQLTEVQRELLSSILESKTINELRALKINCNLEKELQHLAGQGYCKLSPQSKWYLTDDGREELKK
jgi:hypothetical protein